ncbi:MAG TPA: GTP cyclohydrolase I FolE [bacterium]
MSPHANGEELRRLAQSLELRAGSEWESAVRLLLLLMGENPDRDGLTRTPARVKRSLKFLTGGAQQDVRRILTRTFKVKHDEMVVVKDIDFYSLCEHHLLPFFGRCHVAYMPDQRIIGLSKIPRLVDVLSRRLQVQERLTTQIAEALERHLRPLGVACVVEASHLCMMMRGVQKQNARAVTSSMLGVFRSSEKTRAEFLTLIRTPFA